MSRRIFYFAAAFVDKRNDFILRTYLFCGLKALLRIKVMDR